VGGAGVRFGVAYNVVITLGLYQLCTCGLLGAHSSPGPVVRCEAPWFSVLVSSFHAKDNHIPTLLFFTCDRQYICTV
jgi:hypothetical protein